MVQLFHMTTIFNVKVLNISLYLNMNKLKVKQSMYCLFKKGRH